MASPRLFVDAHQHFQDIETHYYPWLSDGDAPPKLEGDLTAIRRNYMPADYLADMASIQLVKSVHVQNGWDPRDPVGETRWLQGLADRGGFPHAIVGYADLSSADVQQVLEAHLAFPNVRGIRQILNWHHDRVFRVAPRGDLMNDAKWRRGYSLLRRFGMSFDLQIYWTQMSDAYRLAADFPDTLLILEHFGMPVDRSAEGVKSWAGALEQLAQAPNVVIKLSGLGLGHPGWTNDDTVPLLRRAIDTFGTDRAMFGTNLPVDLLFSHAGRIILAYEAALEGYSGAEQDALFHSNALQTYRI